MKILFFLLIPAFLLAQVGVTETNLFSSADTVGSITTADSVEVRLGDGPWKLLTQSINDTAYVTVDDKIGEVTKVFILADEDYWTYTNNIKFRVINTGVDTITSNSVQIGGLRGAVTLFIRPDITGTNTKYHKSSLEGD